MKNLIEKFDFKIFYKEIEENNIYAWAYNLYNYFNEHGFYIRKEYDGNNGNSYIDIFIFKNIAYEIVDFYSNDLSLDISSYKEIKEISTDITQYIGDFTKNTSLEVFAF